MSHGHILFGIARSAKAGRSRAGELLLPVATLLLQRLVAYGLRLLRDRQRIEEELAETRKHFESSWSHASIGIALVALNGTFLDVNPALCRLVGYGRDELLRLTFGDITHPDDLEADLGRLRRRSHRREASSTAATSSTPTRRTKGKPARSPQSLRTPRRSGP